jgi:hypothetical protein
MATLKFAGGPQLEPALRGFGSQIAGRLGIQSRRARDPSRGEPPPPRGKTVPLAKSLAIGRAMVAQEEPQPEYSLFFV